MKECADINLDNWVQESCFMSAVTSDPESPKHSMRLGTIKNQKLEIMERSHQERIILYGVQESMSRVTTE